MTLSYRQDRYRVVRWKYTDVSEDCCLRLQSRSVRQTATYSLTYADYLFILTFHPEDEDSLHGVKRNNIVFFTIIDLRTLNPIGLTLF